MIYDVNINLLKEKNTAFITIICHASNYYNILLQRMSLLNIYLFKYKLFSFLLKLK